MKNIAILHAKLCDAGLPIVDLDSNGKISWDTTPTAKQIGEAAGIIGAFSDDAWNFIQARQIAYPPLADQVGLITKALAFLADKGMDIGPDGKDQVRAIEEVKDRFPKPENAV